MVKKPINLFYTNITLSEFIKDRKSRLFKVTRIIKDADENTPRSAQSDREKRYYTEIVNNQLNESEQMFMSFFESFQTRLANRLVEEQINFDTLLEDFETNVFLSRFYMMSVLSENQNFFPFDENYINNEIIDVFKKEKYDSDFRQAIITSLEISRDNLPSFTRKIKEHDFLEFMNLYMTFKKDHSSIHNHDQAFFNKFHNFIQSTLAIDLSQIVFLLNEEKAILKESNLYSLNAFLTRNLSEYEKQLPEWNKFAHRLESESYFECEVARLNKFIISQIDYSNTSSEISSLQSAINRLIHFRDLQSNWDDEGAEEIDSGNLNLAIKTVVDVFIEYQRAPYFIAPTIASGITVEYRNESSRRIDIQIEGDRYAIFIDSNAVVKSKEFHISDIKFLVGHE